MSSVEDPKRKTRAVGAAVAKTQSIQEAGEQQVATMGTEIPDRFCGLPTVLIEIPLGPVPVVDGPDRQALPQFISLTLTHLRHKIAVKRIQLALNKIAPRLPFQGEHQITSVVLWLLEAIADAAEKDATDNGG